MTEAAGAKRYIFASGQSVPSCLEGRFAAVRRPDNYAEMRPTYSLSVHWG